MAKQHVAIGQEPAILRRPRGKFPFHRAIRTYNGHFVALVIATKKTMARPALPLCAYWQTNPSKTENRKAAPGKITAGEG
jgi:hypothetical protein